MWTHLKKSISKTKTFINKIWSPTPLFLKDFFWKDSTMFWKITLKIRILRSLRRLFITLVSKCQRWQDQGEKFPLSWRNLTKILERFLRPSQLLAGWLTGERAAHQKCAPFLFLPKSQLISKANFLVLIWTKNRTKYFFDFYPSL